MPTYLVERELPGADLETVAALRRAADLACRRFEAEGRHIRYMRSTFTPGRSRCSCLFEAPSAELVREVNEAAQIPYSQIIVAIDFASCGPAGGHTCDSREELESGGTAPHDSGIVPSA